jgi:hypothetical protein
MAPGDALVMTRKWRHTLIENAFYAGANCIDVQKVLELREDT